MKTTMMAWVKGFLFGFCVMATVGCQSKECALMEDCCAEIRGEPGVGGTCNPSMIGDISEADKCQTIVAAVVTMYERRGESVPEACRPPADE